MVDTNPGRNRFINRVIVGSKSTELTFYKVQGKTIISPFDPIARSFDELGATHEARVIMKRDRFRGWRIAAAFTRDGEQLKPTPEAIKGHLAEQEGFRDSYTVLFKDGSPILEISGSCNVIFPYSSTEKPPGDI